jgi:hypothetical protein
MTADSPRREHERPDRPRPCSWRPFHRAFACASQSRFRLCENSRLLARRDARTISIQSGAGACAFKSTGPAQDVDHRGLYGICSVTLSIKSTLVKLGRAAGHDGARPACRLDRGTSFAWSREARERFSIPWLLSFPALGTVRHTTRRCGRPCILICTDDIMSYLQALAPTQKIVFKTTCVK